MERQKECRRDRESDGGTEREVMDGERREKQKEVKKDNLAVVFLTGRQMYCSYSSKRTFCSSVGY